MQAQKDGDPEQDQAANHHEEALEAALREAEKQKQSRWNETKNYWSKWESWLSAATFLVVAFYTVITVALWMEQREANDVNSQALEASSRPWLMAENLSIARIEINKLGDLVAHATLNIKNVGHSPAEKVFVEPKLLLWGADNPTTDSVRAICARSPNEVAGIENVSRTIFPDQTVAVSPDTFSGTFMHDGQSLAHAREIQLRERQKSGDTPYANTMILAGCITYSGPRENAVYETGFSFEAKDADPKNTLGWIDLDTSHPGVIPTPPLRIVDPNFGNFAN